MTNGAKAFLVGSATLLLIIYAVSTSPPISSRPSGYRPESICPKDFETKLDYTDWPKNNFTIKLPEGCFSGWVHLPKAWHEWHFDAFGDAKGFWIAYSFEEESVPWGPMYANHEYTPLKEPMSKPFRVQGHGMVVFFTNVEKPMAHANDMMPSNEERPSVTQNVPQTLTKFDLKNADPHLCQKPDDAYFASYGRAVPMPAGSGEFHNPEFEFDEKHGDRTVGWANGFTGKFTFCMVVDEKGNTTNFTFPQSPGPDMEAHIKDHFSGWKHKPGWYTESYRDREPKYVSTQIAYEIKFP